MENQQLLSVIVPCYNEQEVLRESHRRLSESLASLGMDYEIVFVDDGSDDSTLDLLRRIQADDARTRVVVLSRNFGHQLALSAGLERASGNAVVIIDADLQDPPEVIPEMVARWRAGVDVVYGVRTGRAGESAFKRWSASVFYRLISRLSEMDIPLDAGDFRLLDRRVVDVLCRMPERDRFVRGLIAWVGLRQEAVSYERAGRFAGESKYPLGRMLRLALDGILSFSQAPLRFATWIGCASAALALLGAVYALVLRLFTSVWVPGWTLMFIAMMFIGGVQLVILGLMGEYLGRIYGEVKHRPLFLVREQLGFPQPDDRPGSGR